jgi:hypothetical protein
MKKVTTRYTLEVDSVIGPVTFVTSGTSFTIAWNNLKKEIPGIVSLIRIVDEKVMDEIGG